MHRRGSKFTAVMFFVFAVAFSVIFWPNVSLAAKIAFFVTGFGCGAGVARSVRAGS
jgi:hypothetical protein